MSAETRRRLIPILVRAGVLDAERAERLATDVPFPKALSNASLVDERVLAETLAAHTGCALAAPYVADPALDAVLPASAQERYGALPLALDRRTLTVGVWDPTNLRALDDLRFATGLNIVAQVYTWSAIQSALGLHDFDEPTPLDGIPLATLMMGPEVPASTLAAAANPDTLTDLELAKAMKGEMKVLIAPDGEHCSVMHINRRTAVWEQQMRPPGKIYMPIIRRIGVMCGMQSTRPVSSTHYTLLMQIGATRLAYFLVTFERGVGGPRVLLEFTTGLPAMSGEHMNDEAWNSARRLARRADPADAPPLWDRAMALAEGFDNGVGALLVTLEDRGHTEAWMGQYDEAERSFARAHELADDPAFDIWSRTNFLQAMARLMRVRCEPAREVEQVERIRDAYISSAHWGSQSGLYIWLARAYSRCGRDDDAQELLDRVPDLDLRNFGTMTTASVLALACQARIAGGQEGEAMLERAEGMAEQLETSKDPQWTRWFGEEAARPLLQAGELARAEAYARLWVADAFLDARVLARAQLAHILVASGSLAEAEAELSAAAVQVKPPDVMPRNLQAHLFLARARLAEARGASAEAIRLYGLGLAEIRDDDAELRLAALS